MYTQPGRSRSTQRLSTLRRLGTRRLTRAHLALGRRPAVILRGKEAFAAVLAGMSAQLGTELSGQAHLLESSVLPQRCLARGAAFALISLTAVGAPAVVELDLAFLLALTRRLAGARSPIAPVDALTRIEEAAFGHLALVAVASFREAEALESAFRPRLQAITTSKVEAVEHLSEGAHVVLEARLNLADASGLTRILVPARELQGALHGWPAQLGSVSPKVLDACIPIRCFAGRSSLSEDDVAELVAGDVVVLDGLKLEEEHVLGPARLLGSGFELTGKLSPEGFVFSRACSRGPAPEVLMSQSPSAHLPVDVEVELTRLQLPLSELACLQPGYLLPLRMSASEPVLLRVGDRAVARAELVDIEGEVGARILALLP